MNRNTTVLTIISLLSFLSCSKDSEDPGVDCSISDLAIEIAASVKSDCDVPGSVTLLASGGEEDYTYSLDGESFQTSSIFENLFAGGFTFTVRDDVGCTASINFTLESEPTGITLNLSGTESNCTSSTGSISADATGGVGELLYSIDGSGFSATSQFPGLSPGEYSVTVKDEEECSVTKTLQVLTNTSLANDIMPIITKDCAISGCHNGSQSPRLLSTAEVMSNANRIKSETQAGSMPRDRTLTQTEIDLIACWVDDGAKDN